MNDELVKIIVYANFITAYKSVLIVVKSAEHEVQHYVVCNGEYNAENFTKTVSIQGPNFLHFLMNEEQHSDLELGGV